MQGALTYKDSRLAGFNVITLVEVIEHVDAERLDVLAEVVFGHYHPSTVIVTTPNREYNAVFEIPDGKLRHGDHRFEWTRAEFADWVTDVAGTYGYEPTVSGIGAYHESLGQPTQMVVFTR